ALTLPAFLAASAYVGHVAAPSDRVFGVGVVVAFVEAEMLLGVGRRAHDARIQQLADRLLVRPVRRSEGNGHGDAGGVGEMMSLGPGLGAVGGIGPGFFPRPAGLCGARHPRIATARRAQRPDRSAAGAGARSLPRGQARPSVETGGAASNP